VHTLMAYVCNIRADRLGARSEDEEEQNSFYEVLKNDLASVCTREAVLNVFRILHFLW